MKNVIILLTLVIFLIASSTESSFGMDPEMVPKKLNEQFQLKHHEFAIISGGPEISILDIKDSRCPSDVTCVWEGEVQISINVIKDYSPLGNFTLTSRAGDKDLSTQTVDGFTIQVVNVTPYPVSTKQIPLSDYVVTLVVSEKTIPSPLKQLKSGIAAENIQCKDGFQLVIKAGNDSPACVKPSTAAKLVLRGWAKLVNGNTSSGQDQSNKIITLADNNNSIALNKDESFLLKLGGDYDWSIDIDNQTVVSRVMNIAVVKGAQGVYQSHNSGHATLTAVGNPFCLTADPPCKIYSLLFKLDVIVQ